MTPKRVALGFLAIISGLGCLYVATTDVHYRDRNCGTALFKADTNRLAVETGDVGEDQFEIIAGERRVRAAAGLRRDVVHGQPLVAPRDAAVVAPEPGGGEHVEPLPEVWARDRAGHGQDGAGDASHPPRSL